MNATEVDRLQTELRSRSGHAVVLESVLLSAVLFISLSGNLLVFSTVYRKQRLRTISNMFVVALAVSDALMATLCMPYSLATLVHGEWIFSESFCRAHGFFVLTLGQASLQTMALVSVNRFFRIVKTVQYRSKFTPRRTLVYILAVWCNALVGSTPPLFFSFRGYAFQPGKAMCLYRFEANIPYTAFIEVAYIGLPLTLITTCYIAVLREVNRSNKVFSTQGNVNTEELCAHVKESKITKTLIVVFMCFAACWIPVTVVDYLDSAYGEPTFNRRVYLMYGFLVYISSMLNPLVYGLASRSFRREYIAIIRAIFCCQNCRDNISNLSSTRSNNTH
ncbi:melatonin receptor type 1B-B [Nematostella vectensis]|uniref:melatonin receptor type 1B-B n=1 Tax=Nematostella vectensis TaxID=45351 RepID=UPI0020779904|nr:melatonin receptor type 1B-B [Nematostella vectensis]